MPFSIRLAVHSDIDTIFSLENQGFVEGLRESRAVFLERLDTFPSGFYVLLCGQDSSPVGYLSSEIWPAGMSLKKCLFTVGHHIKSQHIDTGSELYQKRPSAPSKPA